MDLLKIRDLIKVMAYTKPQCRTWLHNYTHFNYLYNGEYSPTWSKPTCWVKDNTKEGAR